jgi:fucose permease
VAAISSTQLIVASILAILVYGMNAAMLGSLLPNLSQRFGLNMEQNGNIAFAQALGLIIASISVGPLVDNKGKKTGLLLGLSLITAALFALPSATGYEMVMAFMLLQGLGGGIIVTAANALVSDISEERRSSTLNLLNLFFGLGGMLTPLIASELFAGDAIKLCYLVAVLTAITLAVHAATAMPGPTGERGFKVSEMSVVLGRPALYLLAMLLFLYVACEVGVWNWLAKHLIAQGVPEPTALRILSLGFAFGLLFGRIVVSRILLKVPAVTVTLIVSVLMTITTYLTLQTADTTVAAIAVFCAGLAMAPVFPTALGMTGDAFPKATATAMGIVITAGWVGLAVSSKIIGSIAGGDDAKLKTALLVLPAFSAAMVVVSVILRPMLARK